MHKIDVCYKQWLFFYDFDSVVAASAIATRWAGTAVAAAIAANVAGNVNGDDGFLFADELPQALF